MHSGHFYDHNTYMYMSFSRQWRDLLDCFIASVKLEGCLPRSTGVGGGGEATLNFACYIG